MTKELEERIAKLENELKLASDSISDDKQPKKQHRPFPDKWALTVSLILLVTVIPGWYFYNSKSDASDDFLPASVASQVNYPLYVPERLPGDYVYMEDSVVVQDGVVFYTLTDGTSAISVTIQPKPTSDLDLEITDGLKPLTVASGMAYSGLQGTTPVAILVADQTLVIATGQSSASASDLEAVVGDLQPISTD